ncbi:ThiF family adenylyltransferase [Streptosporangium soli]|nr:ThiF family adenylyltransferase [Streptosporangium sp. KLBMP 9127]
MTSPLRPRLKPALRRFPRDQRTLQFGVHPRRAVVLHDLEPGVRGVIEGLDGTRDLAQVVADATAAGLDPDQARALLHLLARRGVLDDAAARPVPLRALGQAERDRLQPDLDALSLHPGTTDSGYGALERRRGAHIRIYGAGRVGAQVAALLAASGVGHLCVVDPAIAQPRDVVPGGLGWAEVGAPRHDGAVAAARRLAPGVNAWTAAAASRPGDAARPPDLAILAPAEPLDEVLVAELMAAGIPHLLVTAFEGFGSIGPLVLPGRTACLRCVELARRDRDPAWPIVSARLGGFPAGEIACDTVLSTLVAAAASGHALASIDGIEHVVTNGTLDVLPDWGWRRRSWARHPKCRCFRNEFGSLTMVTAAL